MCWRAGNPIRTPASAIALVYVVFESECGHFELYRSPVVDQANWDIAIVSLMSTSTFTVALSSTGSSLAWSICPRSWGTGRSLFATIGIYVPRHQSAGRGRLWWEAERWGRGPDFGPWRSAHRWSVNQAVPDRFYGPGRFKSVLHASALAPMTVFLRTTDPPIMRHGCSVQPPGRTLSFGTCQTCGEEGVHREGSMEASCTEELKPVGLASSAVGGEAVGRMDTELFEGQRDGATDSEGEVSSRTTSARRHLNSSATCLGRS